MSGAIRTEEIYEALFDDEALGRLPEVFARSIGGTTALLHWRFAEAPPEVASWNLRAEDMLEYASIWQKHDPWFKASLGSSFLNRMFLVEEVVPQQQFARSTVYNEFCRTKLDDVFHCIGGTFALPWGAGTIGIHRTRSDKSFDRGDLERINPCTAAVGRVLRVRGELAVYRRKSQRVLSALDAIGHAIIIVRSDGHIEEANSAADIVLRRADGLIQRDGRLAACLHTWSRALLERISQATAAREPRASVIAIERGEHLPPYFLTVIPLAGGHKPSTAMVLFHDPDTEDGALSDRLRSLFNLTTAEACIAVAVSKGLTPGAIAKNRGVGVNTLKTQLKSVRAKMGLAHLSEITALVASLPPIRC